MFFSMFFYLFFFRCFLCFFFMFFLCFFFFARGGCICHGVQAMSCFDIAASTPPFGFWGIFGVAAYAMECRQCHASTLRLPPHFLGSGGFVGQLHMLWNAGNVTLRRCGFHPILLFLGGLVGALSGTYQVKSVFFVCYNM